MTETLHIYGQQWQHDDVLFIGTRDALESLGVLLTAAARTFGQAADGRNFMAADGEGYRARVIITSDATMSELPMPYTDDSAETPSDDPRWDKWREMVR